MIARLIGTLAVREAGRAIIDVTGVGYEVFATERALHTWSEQAGPVTVHVSTQVREDAITLYGFATPKDREAFRVLLGVTGIGPRSALAALDALDVDSMAAAVARDDLLLLSKIPGVGKKTAQRLALELKGKLPVGFEPATARTAVPPPATDPLVLALTQLDYGRPEIEKALRGLEEQGLGVQSPLQERLRAALRVLSGG